MRCAAGLAYDSQNNNSRLILPENECIAVLEKEIDSMEETIPPLKNFILPGGNIIVSQCHIARCVCRRAERAVLRLNESEESPLIINKLLNRLSDFLFVLARKLSYELDCKEISWVI
jgi:cob(I)alamin adenosyltransferase